MTDKIAVPLKHPRTSHLSPYWWNNSYGGIVEAAKKGYKFADQDMQCDKDGCFWNTHWPYPKQDGFYWLWTGKMKGGHEVRVLDPNPNRSIANRSTEEVSRLRRYPEGQDAAWRYTKASKRAHQCEQLGMVMCGEAKGSVGFDFTDNWNRFGTELNKLHVVNFIPMTLSDIGSPVRRGRAMHEATTRRYVNALLPRGHKPKDWDTKWDPAFDRVWGSWK